MDDRRSHRLLHADGAMSCHAEPSARRLLRAASAVARNRGSSPMIGGPATPSVLRESLDTEPRQEMKSPRTGDVERTSLSRPNREGDGLLPFGVDGSGRGFQLGSAIFPGLGDLGGGAVGEPGVAEIGASEDKRRRLRCRGRRRRAHPCACRRRLPPSTR